MDNYNNYVSMIRLKTNPSIIFIDVSEGYFIKYRTSYELKFFEYSFSLMSNETISFNKDVIHRIWSILIDIISVPQYFAFIFSFCFN